MASHYWVSVILSLTMMLYWNTSTMAQSLSKKGVCPPKPRGACPADKEEDKCFLDSDCSGKQKCCEDNCGVLVCRNPKTASATCNVAVDLGILIDASTSITPNNFNKMKTFVKDLVSEFDVREGGTHVAAVTFAGKAQVVLDFQELQHEDLTVENVTQKIEGISQLTGSNRIDLALAMANTNLFSPKGGTRQTSPRILVILTDGIQAEIMQNSFSLQSLNEAADKLKANNVQVFVVAVGDDVKVDQLKKLSSGPSKVFHAKTFSGLRTVSKNLALRSCKACNDPVDIGFAIASNSFAQFEDLRDFVKRTLDYVVLGAKNVQVGLIVYRNEAEVMVKFNQEHNLQELKILINWIPYITSKSSQNRLDVMLQTAANDLFTLRGGVRQGAAKKLVVVGVASDFGDQADIEAGVHQLKSLGVDIIGVAYGPQADTSTLRKISKFPKLENYKEVATITELVGRVPRSVVESSCKAKRGKCPFTKIPERCPENSFQECQVDKDCTNDQKCCPRGCDRRCTAPRQGCFRSFEIAFLLDTSFNVSDEELHRVKDFMKEVANSFSISETGTRFSLVSYDKTAKIHLKFNENFNAKAVINEIDKLDKTQNNEKRLDLGLELIQSDVFSLKAGIRQGVPHVLIVISGGPPSTSLDRLKDISTSLKSDVNIWTVGSGPAVPTGYLKTIASNDEQSHTSVFFENLYPLASEITGKICSDKPGQCPRPNERFCYVGKDDCLQDYECPGFSKCCFDGCRRTCSSPSWVCQKPLDLAFVIESSDNIGRENFKRVKVFAKDLVKALNVDNSQTSIAFLTYGKFVSTHIEFKDFKGIYNKEANLLRAIDRAFFTGGPNSGAHLALARASVELFSRRGGSRKEAIKALIFIVDGLFKGDNEKIFEQALRLKRAGVAIYPVAASRTPNLAALEKIASDKSNEHVFLATSLPAIIQYVHQISQEACKAEAPPQQIRILKGPPGDPGPPGKKGEPGLPGLPGTKGPDGLLGASGLNGEPGTHGLRGLPGSRGPPGPPGPVYIRMSGKDRNGQIRTVAYTPIRRPGQEGIQGVAGVTGKPGPAGPSGPAGDNGNAGMPGHPGLPGVIGPDGRTGSAGQNGKPGQPGTAGNKGSSGEPGLPGRSARKGYKGHKGSTGPTGILGERGEPGVAGSVGKRGQPGLKGARGVSGSPGISGPPGTIGRRGIKGSLGDNGMQGLPGDLGAMGPMGKRGKKGSAGPLGPPGPRGMPGESGDPGYPGHSGPPAADGKKGETGRRGPKGSVGDPGPTGVIGLNGPPASKGPDGEPGPPGLKGKMGGTGKSGPKGSEGAKGIIGNRGVAGMYGNEGLKGKRGVQGDPGLPGSVGLTGERGIQGSLGYVGIDGAPGKKGETGKRGKPGKNGRKGSPGRYGKVGKTGKQGRRGAKGRIGRPGNDGAEGLAGEPGDKGNPGPVGVKGSKGYPGIKGQIGRKGSLGPQGRAGAPGLLGGQGPKGAKGHAGEEGKAGFVGPLGEQGHRGPHGEDGLPGAQGPPGSSGDKGAQGAVGDKGPMGDPGEDGAVGDQGQPGEAGAQGETGELGLNGASGIVGERGPPGHFGPQGPAGFPGAAGQAGIGGTAGNVGRPGLAGEKGERGSPGIKGMTGLPGADGDPGESGLVGPVGLPGMNGEKGGNGIPGISGEPGKVGAVGAKGLEGEPGPSGIAGIAGPPGSYGTSGEVGPIGEKGDAGIPGTSGARGHAGEFGNPGSPGLPGARGERGLRGTAGLEGLPGPPGYTGRTGTRGEGGVAGEFGSLGEKGNTGGRGEIGKTGPAGNKGQPGDAGGEGEVGDSGRKGSKGVPGAAGVAGPIGQPGSRGIIGYVGAVGEEGDIGLSGVNGKRGKVGMYGGLGETGMPGLSGGVGEPGLTGPPGAAGENGNKGTSGFKGMPGDIGVRGDQGSQGVLGTIGLAGRPGEYGIRGEQGDAGPDGVDGPPGLRGPPGRKGQRGNKGSYGSNGQKGSQGEVGPLGFEGSVGERGNKGSKGKIGRDGEKGVMGNNGLMGPAGEKGAIGPAGIKGLFGEQGAIGEQGQKGYKGKRGPPGPPGPPGASLDASSSGRTSFDSGPPNYYHGEDKDKHENVLSKNNIRELSPEEIEMEFLMRLDGLQNDFSSFHKRIGTQQFPALTCRNLFNDHPHFASGNYWLDPNEGATEDAVLVFCDSQRKLSCIFPTDKKTSVKQWFRGGDGYKWFKEDLDETFKFRYTVESTQLTFLQLLSDTVSQNITYHCIKSTAWQDQNGDVTHSIKLLGDNDREYNAATPRKQRPKLLWDNCKSKDKEQRTTVIEITTKKTARLPVRDVAVYDVGDDGELFGLELGPICFS